MKPWTWKSLIGLLLLILVCFGSSLNFDRFVYDDIVLIKKNHVLKKPLSKDIMTMDYWGRKRGVSLGSYRPTTTLMFWFEYRLFGNHPRGYHVVQLVLFFMICCLFAMFVFDIGFAAEESILASYTFAIVTIHTEVIAAITGRADLLMVCLFLLVLWLHRQGRKKSEEERNVSVCWLLKKKHLWFLTIAFLILLGFGTKEFFLMILPTLLVYDILFETDPKSPLPWWKLLQTTDWKKHVYYGMLAAYFFTFRFLATGAAVKVPHFGWMDNPLRREDFWVRCKTVPALLWHYCMNFVTPMQLSFDKTYNAVPVAKSFADIRFWLGGMLLALLCGLFVRFRKSKHILFMLLFFCFAYFPLSNLVVFTPQIVSDRWFLLPSLATSTFVGVSCWAGIRYFSEGGRILRISFYAAILGFFLFQIAHTIHYTYQWRRPLSLYRYGTNSVPMGLKAKDLYGSTLFRHKKYEEAMAAYLEIRRDFPNFMPARFKVARIYELTGRKQMAADVYYHTYMKYKKNPHKGAWIVAKYHWINFLNRNNKARARILKRLKLLKNNIKGK